MCFCVVLALRTQASQHTAVAALVAWHGSFSRPIAFYVSAVDVFMFAPATQQAALAGCCLGVCSCWCGMQQTQLAGHVLRYMFVSNARSPGIGSDGRFQAMLLPYNICCLLVKHGRAMLHACCV
jgi:hypothetical protein